MENNMENKNEITQQDYENYIEYLGLRDNDRELETEETPDNEQIDNDNL